MNLHNASIQFRVPGLPIAKPRQTHKDRWDPSNAVIAYRRWADAIRIVARPVFGVTEPWVGPVAMGAVFLMPVPASWPKRRQRAAFAGELAHTTKPDLDNLLKALKDALQGIAYHNDSQVYCYLEPCMKCYAPADQIGVFVRCVFDEAEGETKVIDLDQFRRRGS